MTLERLCCQICIDGLDDYMLYYENIITSAKENWDSVVAILLPVTHTDQLF